MTVAAVELWGTRIGAVALTDSTGVAAFEYEPAFLASGIQLAPLMMPLEERVYSFPELPRRTFRPSCCRRVQSSHSLPGLRRSP
jgi:serine/threonine-protein kinase HipA